MRTERDLLLIREACLLIGLIEANEKLAEAAIQECWIVLKHMREMTETQRLARLLARHFRLNSALDVIA